MGRLGKRIHMYVHVWYIDSSTHTSSSVFLTPHGGSIQPTYITYNLFPLLINSGARLQLLGEGMRHITVTCMHGMGGHQSGSWFAWTLQDTYSSFAFLHLMVDRSILIYSYQMPLVSSSNLQWGRTPVYIASGRGHGTVIKMLIEAKADINHSNEV